MITSALDCIYASLEGNPPARLINSVTKAEITDLRQPDRQAIVEPGAFRLNSHEWGVNCSAMLTATRSTGDPKYAAYATDRINFLANLYSNYKTLWNGGFQEGNPCQHVFQPESLDDCGSMCAALIKASRTIDNTSLRPIIDGYADSILNHLYRRPDGILARNRPNHNTVWLDDMYLSIPALAQLGALTRDAKYFDEATKQVRLFAGRMFVPEKGLFRLGWVEGMTDHPAFYWGRANGWAILAMSELLDVLPPKHPDRDTVLALYRAHIKGLLQYQAGNGFWHQLLDRNDSYEESSATAIFTYCLAHGANQGWLDAGAYGPPAILGWNAVSTKISASGEVEGTCVGTDMGLDPAFYYYRTVSPLAAHAYGPAIMAGAETDALLQHYQVVINEASVMLYPRGVDWRPPPAR